MQLNENNQNMFEPLVKQLQKEQDTMDQVSASKTLNLNIFRIKLAYDFTFCCTNEFSK
jgi:hypothetical protein